VRSELERHRLRVGRPSAVVVDYIGLMAAPGLTNEVAAIGHITGALKTLARELEIPVVALAQVNREPARRDGQTGGHRPRLSDLRSSGSIENDADNVLMVFRPGMYEAPGSADDPGTGEVAELILAKCRAGRTGTIRARWFGMRYLLVPEPPDGIPSSQPAQHEVIAMPVLRSASTLATRIVETVERIGSQADGGVSRADLLMVFGIPAGRRWQDTELHHPVQELVVTGRLRERRGAAGRVVYALPDPAAARVAA